MNDKAAQKVPAPLGPVERGVRPACWEFAMDFLGDPEAPIVNAYVSSLEAEVARLVEQQKDTSMGEQKQSLNTQLANAVAAVASAQDYLNRMCESAARA